jgi:hypothetical protein
MTSKALPALSRKVSPGKAFQKQSQMDHRRWVKGSLGIGLSLDCELAEGNSRPDVGPGVSIVPKPLGNVIVGLLGGLVPLDLADALALDDTDPLHD